MPEDVKETTWERISEVFADPKYSMWGDNEIEADDAIQGGMGDCWLLTAAMALATDPNRIKDIFKI